MPARLGFGYFRRWWHWRRWGWQRRERWRMRRQLGAHETASLGVARPAPAAVGVETRPNVELFGVPWVKEEALLAFFGTQVSKVAAPMACVCRVHAAIGCSDVDSFAELGAVSG